MFKEIITWISWFGRISCLTWRGIGYWINISKWLWKYCLFLCHNSTIGTRWLRQSGSIYDGQTRIMFFYLVYSSISFEFGWNLLTLWWGWAKGCWLQRKPQHEKKFSHKIFSIIVLWVGSAAYVNGPVIFLEKGTSVHPGIRDTNLVTRYGLP